MNKLQKILGVGVISLPLLLGGCDKIENVLSKIPITHTEYSNVLQEDAEVVDVDYKLLLPLPKRIFTVVFKCQHGKFTVEDRYLWERMVKGQDVDVAYKEIYEATYKDLNNDGKRDLVERKLVKYDFLDAQPKGEQK